MPDMQCNTIQLNVWLYFIPCEEKIWREKREKRAKRENSASEASGIRERRE